MKKLAAILSVLAIVAVPAIAMTADGQPSSAPPAGTGKVVAENMVAENATVKAIDLKKRTITLLLSDGRTETFAVGKEAKRLGEVKVGDTVRATYHEAVSVKINKTKVPEGVNVEESVKPAERPAGPGATARLRVTTTATIEKIYDDGRKVTLRMPNGSSADVRVRDPKNLEKIKKGEVKEGDQIEITYKRAVAIAVEKVAK